MDEADASVMIEKCIVKHEKLCGNELNVKRKKMTHNLNRWHVLPRRISC